ncbi:hypothetical protein SHKM778_14880 [Streptomyces sp. KM77-8]|uniref:Uncharacterized protein n=1 Tax=Streptomyces haneummycinicus TaxID=3074435 RepID=A0AAT9HCK0_9ACTN
MDALEGARAVVRPAPVVVERLLDRLGEERAVEFQSLFDVHPVGELLALARRLGDAGDGVELPRAVARGTEGYVLSIFCAYVRGAAGVSRSSPREAESRTSRAWSPVDCACTSVPPRSSATWPATTTASTVVTAAAAIPVNARPLPPLADAGSPAGGVPSARPEGMPVDGAALQSVTAA